jgi:hypothetical protein
MSVEIIEVNDKKRLKAFIDLPWKLYKDDPVWVPPLKMAVKDLLNKKHPFYETGETKMWLALQNGEAVGRIMGVIPHVHNEYQEVKFGFFGFFETINDSAVAKSLIETAENYCKENGMESMQGPFSPTTNYECGLLVKGFDDPPQIMMTYNPEYYQTLIIESGYTKAKDLLAFKVSKNVQLTDKILKVAAHVEKSNNITYRKVNLKKWDDEVQKMLEIYNSAWEKNWGFIPMTEKEFIHTGKDLKSVVDENLIIFVQHKGEDVGFLVGLPDYNQVFKKIPSGKLLPTGILKLLNPKKYITRFRVVTLGVKSEYRALGLGSLLFKQAQIHAQKVDYINECEQSWVLEDNSAMINPIVQLGAEQYKTYRIFEKPLS